MKTPKSANYVKSGLVAAIVGCGDSTVRQVRNGSLSTDTELYTTIVTVDNFLGNGVNKLVEAAKKLVPFN